MMNKSNADPLDMSAVANLENRLAAELIDTADELAHTECLDCEQRSEIYTIIQSLQADTRMHQTQVKLMARGSTPKAIDV